MNLTCSLLVHPHNSPAMQVLLVSPIVQNEKQKVTQQTTGRGRIQTQILLAPKPTYWVFQRPTPQSPACFAASLLTSSQLVD